MSDCVVEIVQFYVENQAFNVVYWNSILFLTLKQSTFQSHFKTLKNPDDKCLWHI